MAGNNINLDDQESASKFQKIGMLLALLFYLVSVAAVVYNRFGSTLLDPDAKILTFAHWQLEDGFRQGFDKAIKDFEALQKSKGNNVRVVQTAIPIRTYQQWLLTQLVSGNPADIIEINCSSDVQNQYFVPLSSYIGEPNPYNAGTPLEGIPWNDTYIDDMNNALDSTYAEYFGVGAFMFTNRMYVNLDLLEKATGSRKMPADLPEWMEMCRKVKQYGKDNQIQIIPIGNRGLDKGTIGQLFVYYYQQLNADLNDRIATYETEATQLDQLNAVLDGTQSYEKLMAANDILQEIGQYFGDGFSSVDLEQTKYLFASGQVVFFPEGTWNAYSMVNNSPFAVGIVDVPPIGKNHKYSKYFVGRPSEQGAGTGGLFGITKASKHFDLALDFLRYVTSYNVNQMIMIDHARWLSMLKGVKYSGFMTDIQPILGAGYTSIFSPITIGRCALAMKEEQESSIVENRADALDSIYRRFQKEIPRLITDMDESILGSRRNLNNVESMRTFTAFGTMVAANDSDRRRFERQGLINFENLINSGRTIRTNSGIRDILPRFTKEKE